MRTANVSELKSRLSSYLAYVQQGEEIIVRDRNRPIARIVPLTTEGGDEIEETALVAAGVIKLRRATHCRHLSGVGQAVRSPKNGPSKR